MPEKRFKAFIRTSDGRIYTKILTETGELPVESVPYSLLLWAGKTCTVECLGVVPSDEFHLPSCLFRSDDSGLARDIQNLPTDQTGWRFPY